MLFAIVDWAEATKRASAPAPRNPTFRETLRQLAENRRVKRELGAWRRTCYTRADDGFQNHELFHLTNTFLEAWRNSNFGTLAALASRRIGKQKSKSGLAGELRRDFEFCNLTEFAIDELEHHAPAIWLTRGTAVMNGSRGTFECRWLLEDAEGKSGLALMRRNGTWYSVTRALAEWEVDSTSMPRTQRSLPYVGDEHLRGLDEVAQRRADGPPPARRRRPLGRRHDLGQRRAALRHAAEGAAADLQHALQRLRARVLLLRRRQLRAVLQPPDRVHTTATRPSCSTACCTTRATSTSRTTTPTPTGTPRSTSPPSDGRHAVLPAHPQPAPPADLLRRPGSRPRRPRHATASAALQRLNRFQASNRFYAANRSSAGR